MKVYESHFLKFLVCGEPNDESRIVGGHDTKINEFPWMARLSYFNRFYCGGKTFSETINLYFMSYCHGQI